MANSEIKYDLSFAYSLFNDMQTGNLNYIYRGFFTQNITDNILALTENSLNDSGESSKIKKRVYTILVEGLQNITRHQDETEVDTSEKSGIFVIQKKENKYFITTGNIIEDSKIENLRNLLEKINSLQEEELKLYYKEVLETGELSNKGGAGLGLIEMARKSNNKLIYDFVKLYKDLSYFYLHSGISFRDDTFAQIEQELIDSLKNVIQLHRVLNKENIQLVFNGFFSQETLVSLLSIIEGQMNTTYALRKQLFCIVVELLQNIVKHGEANSQQGEKGSPGMFFISRDNEKHLLTTGNYLKTKEIQELAEKIDFVNALSEQELDDYYNNNLLSFENENCKKSGLGIIDLRIKSKNKLVYAFNKVDETYSFFTLQVTV
jgi:anti-sigma regulatory factor (Ser/Thr protein kinase)